MNSELIDQIEYDGHGGARSAEGADVLVEAEPDYARRVRELEAEGLSTSDSQAVADAELLKASRATLNRSQP